ncbi:hypothetical protein VTK26DRAFT_1093 [Humicola hyalothermophila]
MKLINSAAFELTRAEKNIEELERRIAELTLENQELRAQRSKLNSTSTVPAPSQPSTGSGASEAPANAPSEPKRSFMRGTAASNNRTAANRREQAAKEPKSTEEVDNRNVSPTVTVNGWSYKYADGRILREDDASGIDQAHFLRPTKASFSKEWVTWTDRTPAQKRVLQRQYTWRQQVQQRKVTEEILPLEDTSGAGASEPNPTSAPGPADAGSTKVVEEWGRPPSPDPLPVAQSTQGTYVNWISEERPLAHVFTNHELAMRGLRKAFHLARASLWDLYRQRYPEAFELQRGWSYGPSFLRGAWGELEDARRYAPRALRDAMERFSDLRNYLAHPSPRYDLDGYDYYLRIAEDLAKLVDDQPRLRGIRKIRDREWRAEAERTLEQIGNEAIAAVLPFASGRPRRWKERHLIVFQRIQANSNNPAGYEFPAIALLAAEMWKDAEGA